jgi:hypothetical protein
MGVEELGRSKKMDTHRAIEGLGMRMRSGRSDPVHFFSRSTRRTEVRLRDPVKGRNDISACGCQNRASSVSNLTRLDVPYEQGELPARLTGKTRSPLSNRCRRDVNNKNKRNQKKKLGRFFDRKLKNGLQNQEWGRFRKRPAKR